MGKAIVSTPAGVNGLEVRPNVDVLVANDGGTFAAAVSSLLGDPERRQAIGVCARETVERIYDWDVIAVAQDRLYRRLVKS